MAYFSTYRDFIFCGEAGEDIEPEPLTDFPVAITLDEFFAFYYRVKTWKLLLSGDFVATTPFGDVTYTAAGLDEELSAFSPMTSEDEFACKGDFLFNLFLANTGTLDLPGLGVVTPVSLRLDFSYGATEGNLGYKIQETSPDNFLYIPKLRVDLTIDYVTGGPEGYQGNLRSYTGTVDAGDVDMNGIIIPLAYTDTLGATSVASTLSFSISPSVYWEYDPNDGDGPIFNSSTGAEDRDPFSVQQSG